MDAWYNDRLVIGDILFKLHSLYKKDTGILILQDLIKWLRF